MARQITEINEFIEQEKINFKNQMDPECEYQKVILNNEDEEALNEKIENFYEEKQQFDKYKKSTEKTNKEIKELLSKLNKTEFETENGITAKISVSNRESFIEDALINKLKELKVSGIIKTKEYVDMDALEDAIYNGKLNASELSNCRQSTKTVTLRVTKK